MALIDLVKDKNTPKPEQRPGGNIPTDSPNGAGIDTRRQPNLIDQAKTINPLGGPQGRHLENGRDILPQGNPQGRHINSGKTILPQGSPMGRHINSGNTVLPQGGTSGRHIQSPLGKGSLRKSPLAGE